MESADLLARMRALGGVWDAKRAHQLLLETGEAQSQRSTERLLDTMAELPSAREFSDLIDEDQRPLKPAVVRQLANDAKRKRQHSWVLQCARLGDDLIVLVNDGRLARQPDLVALAGGASAVAALAQTQIDAGDFELALHSADIALSAEPDNRRALEARLAAFGGLLAESDNSNEIGWLRHGVRETQAALDQL